jgi:hypothetical protein
MAKKSALSERKPGIEISAGSGSGINNGSLISKECRTINVTKSDNEEGGNGESVSMKASESQTESSENEIS